MDEQRGTGAMPTIASSGTLTELAPALAKAQGAFPAIKKERTAKIDSAKASYAYAYADLSDILDATRKPLADNGLSVVQPIVGVWLVTRLLHASGQWIESAYELEQYERPQEQGSAITYARRYALTALLGVAAEEDDDGAAAQGATSRSAGRSTRPACPKCGKAEAVYENKPDKGPGFYCWKQKGGCGNNWNPAAPVPDLIAEIPPKTAPAPPPSAGACKFCGSVNAQPDPFAPGYLHCSDCGKGSKA